MFTRSSFLISLINICFIFSYISPTISHAQMSRNGLDRSLLPVPGTMINLSPSYTPALIKGVTVHKDNPFLFDFIVDAGQDVKAINNRPYLKEEADRLVKYFFACLTIADKDLWVNLSPYEKDRMVPEALGKTALGRDLLAQDYVLKQLTASLIYPEKDLGKEFWNKIYAKAQQLYGTTEIPMNTFNKVWIVADKASIYEHGQTAFIVDGHLKVMMEQDYLAMEKHSDNNVGAGSKPAQATRVGLSKDALWAEPTPTANVAAQIVRDIIIPAIETEVNTGKNFAMLRQIFYSQILATWFKRNLKEALLTQAYANKGTVKGIDHNDAKTNEAIYQQYLQAYKKGVFNYIKEETQPDGQITSKKYFSGGYHSDLELTLTHKHPDLGDHNYAMTIELNTNAAMTIGPPDRGIDLGETNFSSARELVFTLFEILHSMSAVEEASSPGEENYLLRFSDVEMSAQVLKAISQEDGKSNAVIEEAGLIKKAIRDDHHHLVLKWSKSDTAAIKSAITEVLKKIKGALFADRLENGADLYAEQKEKKHQLSPKEFIDVPLAEGFSRILRFEDGTELILHRISQGTLEIAQGTDVISLTAGKDSLFYHHPQEKECFVYFNGGDVFISNALSGTRKPLNITITKQEPADVLIAEPVDHEVMIGREHFDSGRSVMFALFGVLNDIWTTENTAAPGIENYETDFSDRGYRARILHALSRQENVFGQVVSMDYNKTVLAWNNEQSQPMKDLLMTHLQRVQAEVFSAHGKNADERAFAMTNKYQIPRKGFVGVPLGIGFSRKIQFEFMPLARSYEFVLERPDENTLIIKLDNKVMAELGPGRKPVYYGGTSINFYFNGGNVFIGNPIQRRTKNTLTVTVTRKEKINAAMKAEPLPDAAMSKSNPRPGYYWDDVLGTEEPIDSNPMSGKGSGFSLFSRSSKPVEVDKNKIALMHLEILLSRLFNHSGRLEIREKEQGALIQEALASSSSPDIIITDRAGNPGVIFTTTESYSLVSPITIFLNQKLIELKNLVAKPTGFVDKAKAKAKAIIPGGKKEEDKPIAANTAGEVAVSYLEVVSMALPIGLRELIINPIHQPFTVEHTSVPEIKEFREVVSGQAVLARREVTVDKVIVRQNGTPEPLAILTEDRFVYYHNVPELRTGFSLSWDNEKQCLTIRNNKDAVASSMNITYSKAKVAGVQPVVHFPEKEKEDPGKRSITFLSSALPTVGDSEIPAAKARPTMGRESFSRTALVKALETILRKVAKAEQEKDLTHLNVPVSFSGLQKLESFPMSFSGAKEETSPLVKPLMLSPATVQPAPAVQFVTPVILSSSEVVGKTQEPTSPLILSPLETEEKEFPKPKPIILSFSGDEERVLEAAGRDESDGNPFKIVGRLVKKGFVKGGMSAKPAMQIHIREEDGKTISAILAEIRMYLISNLNRVREGQDNILKLTDLKDNNILVNAFGVIHVKDDQEMTFGIEMKNGVKKQVTVLRRKNLLGITILNSDGSKLGGALDPDIDPMFYDEEKEGAHFSLFWTKEGRLFIKNISAEVSVGRGVNVKVTSSITLGGQTFVRSVLASALDGMIQKINTANQDNTAEKHQVGFAKEGMEGQIFKILRTLRSSPFRFQHNADQTYYLINWQGQDSEMVDFLQAQLDAISLDAAMSAPNKTDQAQITPKHGGIDLNSENIEMDTTKDATGGVGMKVDQAMINKIMKDGLWSLDPVIIRIAPVGLEVLRPLLGMKEESTQLALL